MASTTLLPTVSSIPATTFHSFPLLPFELQSQIFLFASPPPTIFEVAFDHNLDRSIITPLESAATLHAFFHLAHPALPPSPIPIEIRRAPKLNTRLKCIRNVIIYLRPTDDTLYLHSLEGGGITNSFDFQDFGGNPNNQLLRKVAVTFSHARTLSFSNALGGNLVRLLRDLKNLETLFVVDGFVIHAESRAALLENTQVKFLPLERGNPQGITSAEVAQQVCLWRSAKADGWKRHWESMMSEQSHKLADDSGLWKAPGIQCLRVERMGKMEGEPVLDWWWL